MDQNNTASADGISFLVFDSVLGVATFRLELDELLGDVVAGPLRKYPQHGPSGLVESDALGQRTPAGTAASLGHVPQLQHRHADQPVLACEAVVFHAQMQLVTVRLRLVAQNTAIQKGQPGQLGLHSSGDSLI